MDEENVLSAELVAYLACGFDKRLAFNVADGSTDFGNDDVGCRLFESLQSHAALDLVGDVRNDLDSVTEVFTTTFALDDAGIDLTGGDVGGLRQVDVEKTLVVSDVEVGLGSVISDKHLTVLERVHRSRVDVEIRVEFLHDNAQTAASQKVAE